ncbi:hypothetical protein [Aeromonas aquatica]|uniref:hypothetical protein n=1 Tax=Aeromonas aquatica TaxID=558964 RepID=UPI004043BDEB
MAELIEIWWAHKGQYQKWGVHFHRTLKRAYRYWGGRVSQLDNHALTLLCSCMLTAGILPNCVNRLVVE